MSVSKPFVFALVCEALGAETARADGSASTPPACPSTRSTAVEQSADGRTNPMVNPGAIATTSLVPGEAGARWELVHEGLSRFAGRTLVLDEEVYALRLGDEPPEPRHRAPARGLRPPRLRPRGGGRPLHAAVLAAVTAHDLAAMGATLADGGVNPLTGERVVAAETCRHTLAVMTTAGLYETSGDWLYDVGLPGKSGIGGGIVTVAPGQGRARHVRAAARRRGQQRQGTARRAVPLAALGLDLFGSEPGLTAERGRIARRERAAPRASCSSRRSRWVSPRPRRRPRRRDRRSPRSTRRSFALVEQAEECGPGEPYEPMDVDALFDESTVALRGPWNAFDLVKIGPTATTSPGSTSTTSTSPGTRSTRAALRAVGAAAHARAPSPPSTRTSRPRPARRASSRCSTGSSTPSTTSTTRTRATGR